MGTDMTNEVLRYRLAVDDRAARRARHVAVAVLRAWSLDWLADPVSSCVSELVGNVYVHASAYGPDCELIVCRAPGNWLAVEVRDRDPRLPQRRTLAETRGLESLAGPGDAKADDWLLANLAESGRGLALVEALCDQLAWHSLAGSGKVVRCCWLLPAVVPAVHDQPMPSDYLRR